MKYLNVVAVALVALGLVVSGPALAGKSKKNKKTTYVVTEVEDSATSSKKNKKSSSKTSKSDSSDDDSGTSSGGSGTSTSGAYTSGAATLDHGGRLLASNCFQCHGTNGHGMESLAGQPASEISNEMFEMQRESISADIMHVYAHSLTDEQIGLIADYFSKQQR